MSELSWKSPIGLIPCRIEHKGDAITIVLTATRTESSTQTSYVAGQVLKVVREELVNHRTLDTSKL